MTKLKWRWLQYLESPHWIALRREAFERDGYRCTICKTTKRLRGHHKTYRSDLTKCTVNDIQTLCEDCHNRLHKEQKLLRKLNRRKRNGEKVRHPLINVLLEYDAEDPMILEAL